jgi:hypothetical protein
MSKKFPTDKRHFPSPVELVKPRQPAPARHAAKAAKPNQSSGAGSSAHHFPGPMRNPARQGVEQRDHSNVGALSAWVKGRA